MVFRIRAATQDEIQRGNLWSLQYLGEGAANIVFAFRSPSYAPQGSCECRHPVICTTASGEDASTQPSLMQNRVLRFSKDAPNAPSCSDIATYFTNITSRFFDGDTARHRAFHGIIEVEQPLVDYLNTLLKQWGMLNHRKAGCERSFIRTDDLNCLLLPDLTSIPGSSTTIEIKPKWLLQSPTAPWLAVRCRTCALRAQRAAKGDARKLMLDHGAAPFCPLLLVLDDPLRFTCGVGQLFSERLRQEEGFKALSPDLEDSMVMMVIDYFRTGPGRALLLKLRLWQQELDPAGFESTSHEGIFARDGGRGFAMPIGVARERLKVAMTFRDCSMFVCVHYGAEVPFVEAYLVDLDPKVDEKVGEWLDKEVGLLNQGWYTGKEEGAKREKVCVLAGQMKWDTRGERMWWL